MLQYEIRGGAPLHGSVTISGAKNAAVAILPAAILVDGVSRIENIPEISDVTLLLQILQDLGANVRVVNKNTVEIDASGVRNKPISDSMARKMRASYYFLGSMLGRFGKAQVPPPGGCGLTSSGTRPIDQHIKGFTSLGAEVSIREGYVHATAQGGRLKGNNVYLDVVSVGATMNIMMAAVLADGMTVIENAAKEPHIVDLANFLNSMGANIMGAGTDVIKIRAVDRLPGGSYSIIPDQIEAGTFMAAAVAVGGDVLIQNVIPKHLESISAKLLEMGAEITEYDDSIRVVRNNKLVRTNIKTMPYPGFPTDLQPQVAVSLCLAEGTSILTEGVWDNRFRYLDELRRMGVQVQVDGKVAVFEGVDALTPAKLRACDLRAGAAMVIAGLCAEGVTTVDEIHHIERGYENLIEKITSLGGDIRLIEVPDDEPQVSEVHTA